MQVRPGTEMNTEAGGLAPRSQSRDGQGQWVWPTASIAQGRPGEEKVLFLQNRRRSLPAPAEGAWLPPGSRGHQGLPSTQLPWKQAAPGGALPFPQAPTEELGGLLRAISRNGLLIKNNAHNDNGNSEYIIITGSFSYNEAN